MSNVTDAKLMFKMVEEDRVIDRLKAAEQSKRLRRTGLWSSRATRRSSRTDMMAVLVE